MELSCNFYTPNKYEQKPEYANRFKVKRQFLQTLTNGWAYLIERKYGSECQLK